MILGTPIRVSQIVSNLHACMVKYACPEFFNPPNFVHVDLTLFCVQDRPEICMHACLFCACVFGVVKRVLIGAGISENRVILRQHRNSVWSTCCMRGSNLHARMQICRRAKSACMHGRAIGLAAVRQNACIFDHACMHI